MFLEEYAKILIFIIVAVAISVFLAILPFIVNRRKNDKEKLSQYECGFEAEGKIRNKLNIDFYTIAILFIIFDIEIAFLFPFVVSLSNIGIFGYFSVMFFLLILTIGFLYEVRKGAIDIK